MAFFPKVKKKERYRFNTIHKLALMDMMYFNNFKMHIFFHI